MPRWKLRHQISNSEHHPLARIDRVRGRSHIEVIRAGFYVICCNFCSSIEVKEDLSQLLHWWCLIYYVNYESWI